MRSPPREQRLDERARPAGRPQRGLVAAGARGRVQVERLAARAHVAHARRRTRAGARAAAAPRVAAGASRGSQPSHSRLSSSASIARIRSARSGWPWPVSCSSEAGWRKNGGMRAGTVPARRGRALSAPTSQWLAPAPPASTPRSWRPTRARASRSSAARRSRRPRATGRRAGSPPRWRRTTRPRSTPPTRSPPAARPPARARCGCSARSRPTRVRDLQELGVQFDADRGGNLALGLEGGHSQRRIVHAGGAATGRRITRALSALAATHERMEVLEPLAATAIATRRRPRRRPRPAVARRRAAHRLGARGDPRHRRHGRALAAHHEPARRGGLRAQPRQRRPAPSSPTSSSCSSTRRRCGSTARATASS